MQGLFVLLTVKSFFCEGGVMQGIPPFLSSVHFSGEAKVFYSPLPDSLLISSLFYCTARRNGEQNEKPFLSFLAETVSMSPSHCQQLHPFHIFLFCVSLVQRQLLYKHIDWAEPSSLKKNREECVRVPRFFFFEDKKWGALSRLSHSLDNQVLVEIKGGESGERWCFSTQRSFGSLW